MHVDNWQETSQADTLVRTLVTEGHIPASIVEKSVLGAAAEDRSPDYRLSEQNEIPEITANIGKPGHKYTRTDRLKHSTSAYVILTKKNWEEVVSVARSDREEENVCSNTMITGSMQTNSAFVKNEKST